MVSISVDTTWFQFTLMLTADDLSFSGYLFRAFFSVMWNMEKLHLPMMEWLLQASVCVHPEVVLDHPPCTSCSVIPPLSGRGSFGPRLF